jgi:hypothetical protein
MIVVHSRSLVRSERRHPPPVHCSPPAQPDVGGVAKPEWETVDVVSARVMRLERSRTQRHAVSHERKSTLLTQAGAGVLYAASIILLSGGCYQS